ncbi:hypothetical protein VT47_09825 [Pseudomonas syringae pv. syringae]|uniref:UvrD-helicase domain-containing protein n=1 Tax=Pseudomonas syringae TaxID=317 RepID=UPI0007AEA4A9|nr:UvrD-helicase domain-containing protein [Pseudomonas syringae]KZL39462.1 hypothetical protein VT47_09825 [Pseudomonas syringae pv. syringae]
MVSPEAILALSRQAVVAPAGHGKTELIAKVAALGTRTLVLTHTHAGVHAIRARLKKLHVPSESVVVDTIASWACKYVQAFPGRAGFPAANPKTAQEWNNVYLGASLLLQSSVVRDVIRASYDRVLIDEYQDCEQYQHDIAMQLSSIVPTVIFGDPMQGIFEFVESRISWKTNVGGSFPQAYELQEPYRWASTNPELGQWIAQVRQQLQKGEPINLQGGPVRFIQSDSAFDMSLFFDDIDARQGSTAGIYCWRNTCNDLAKTTRGAFQAIEEIAARRLIEFAAVWDDTSANSAGRLNALRLLIDDAMTRAPADPLQPVDPNLQSELLAAWDAFSNSGLESDALEVLRLERAHPLNRTYRGELITDARRALGELVAGRHSSMVVASEAVRHRLSIAGRAPVARTISTPLLLKGLEFDHVLIPDANHYVKQQHAAAKLFYVAISRARYSLTISAKTPILQFPLPNL